MLSSRGVRLCYVTVHLLDVQETTWHVQNTYSHALLTRSDQPLGLTCDALVVQY